MYEPKLSIIIPTKNRQQYAFKCIATLLEFQESQFEIVVQDNSDEPLLQEMLGSRIDGKKLKYAYDNRCLSFCANFEKSVELSSGDYLIIIGDDDCVFPEIVQMTNVMREKRIDAAVFDTHTTYIWPNAVSEKGGMLVVRKQREFVKTVSTSSALSSMISVGNYDYQQYPFPKIYHGIINREKLDLVKSQTGSFFGGLTPDIYSAVALSFYVDRILYISIPFTMPGTCAKSGSADSLTGRHTGELKDAPHFRGHESYEWDQAIPYVYSVDTIWAETAFKAIAECGRNIYLSDEDYFALLVHIVNRNPAFKDRMVKLYADRINKDISTTKKIFEHSVKKIHRRSLLKKGWRFGLQVLKGRHVYNDVEDIGAALQIARKEINNHHSIINKIRNGEW